MSWFESYLANRNQFTAIDSSVSSKLTVSIGVPQGSILGPLLFIIHINGIHNACLNSRLTLFADDSNAIVIENKIIDLFKTANSVCNDLHEWLMCNRLTVNVAKSAFILFHPSKIDEESIITNNLSITMDNRELDRVNSITFLGIMIDDKLTFSQHIIQLTSKINGVNSILFKRNSGALSQKLVFCSCSFPHQLWY